MNGALVVVVVLVGVLIAGAIAYGSYVAAKKRREAFATWAAGKGWAYAERDDSWLERFTDSPFDDGHNRSAKNVVTGTYDGRRFVSFDYRYYTTQTVSNGKTTTTRQVPHDFGVVALDTGVRLPALAVTPESMLGRFVGHLTGNDIELESEDFNRAFTVHCPDRKFASDVLHPLMMEQLMRNPSTSFRFNGSHALSVEDGQVPIESIEPRLVYLDQILDQVPEFVWQDLGRDGR